MATDLERLVVQFSADFKRLENEMKKNRTAFDRQLRDMEKKADASVKRINQAFGGIGRIGSAAKGLLAGVSVAAVQSYIDSALRIENALKVAGLSGQELDRVYQRLFASAQKNAAPLETLVTLYGRISLVQKELGASTNEVLKFSDTIAMALRVAGTNPEQASGALLQLSQALGGGVVRAEEFNSLMEGGLPILQAAAAGIKEAGGSVAKLRELMLNGELSSKAFFRGIEAGTPVLQDRLSNAVLTIDQRLTNLKTALTDAAKRFNASSQAANTFGSGIDAVSNALNNLDISGLVNDINTIVSVFARGEAAARNFGYSVGEALGLDNIGAMLTGGKAQVSYLGGALTITSQKGIKDRINAAFSDAEQKTDAAIDQLLRDKYLPASKGARVSAEDVKPDAQTTVKPISLADYPASGQKTKSGTRGGSKNRTKSTAAQINDDIRTIQDRTEALRVEAQLVGKSYYEQEKRRMALDLEQQALAKLRDEALKKGQADLSNIKLSEDQRAKIDAVSEAYARQADELRRIEENQQRAEQAADEFYDNFKGSVTGAITGAQSLSDALADILNKLADMLMNAAFDALFKPGQNGGAFGSIFDGIGKILGFHNGGPVKAATGGLIRGQGGPRTDSIPARLSDGEYVINAAATKRNRALLDAINSGKIASFADGGPVLKAPTMPILRAQRQPSAPGPMRVDVGVSVDNNGNLQAYVKSVARTESQGSIKSYDKTGALRLRRDSQQAGRRGIT